MATNDNTLKTLGFIYQAYIGLIKCLEMSENEKIVMEHFGDVTLISTSRSSQQIEVKHHLKDTRLSDRSNEIWNSVWNWYNNFDEYNNMDEMILFTTARISQKSILRDWNSLDANARYELFKHVGLDSKSNEREFRKTYNKIYSTTHDPVKLKSVLNRFKILSAQQNIKSIVNDYYKTTFRFLGEQQTMEEFVSSLIGVLLTIPVHQNKWELSYKDFNDLFKRYAQRFSDESETPLQLSFEYYEPTQPEIISLSKKCFVSEIQRIDMSDEVTEAINDYCRANKTIITFFENNIVKAKDLKDYRNQLQKKIIINKKLLRLNCGKDFKIFLTESQKLYLQSMMMEAQTINGISNNRDFFQRGVIHSIVDDGDLTWHMGDSK